MIISEELLGHILNKKILKVRGCTDEFRKSILFYVDEVGIVQEVNVYEIAGICKDLATRYNFHLISWTILYPAAKRKGYCQTHNTQDAKKEADKPFYADTESEAIVKAYEWILEQEKDKK